MGESTRGGSGSATASSSSSSSSGSSGSSSGSSSRSSSGGKKDPLKDRRDNDGNLTDPPIIPEYEQRIAAAAAAVDIELINDLTAEYHEAREEVALADHERAQRRKKRLRNGGESS
jgi:hypothetical protein